MERDPELNKAPRKAPRVDRVEDLRTDLAGAYRQSHAPAATNVDANQLRTDSDALDAQGFVVLESLISTDEAARVKAALETLLGPVGRNAFEGFHTQRAYALLEKPRAVDALVGHPRVLALVEHAVAPDPLLSACLAININPGEVAQMTHVDDGFYPESRPRRPLSAAAIWALDPFTADNGATVAWPGSHRWADARQPTEVDPHQAVIMPAGSAVVFSGTLWHGGGANRSDASRLALTPQYCAPWLRTQENMSLAVSPRTVAGLSEELKRLLGYNIRPPFMGHVNGMHPKRLLEKFKDDA